ncbi:MAG: hypothetical protein C0625_07500 [Arcobacter sp.]|nr:MAG: hypothetical protein C0625_07500 [Arcobacter sp.]
MISKVKSVKSKLLFVYGGILILVLLFFNAILYYYAKSYFYEHTINSLKSVSRDVVFDDIEGKKLKEGITLLSHKYDFSISNVYIQVFYNNKIVLKSINMQNFELPFINLKNKNESIDLFKLKNISQYDILMFSSKVLDGNYIVQVATTEEETQKSLNTLRRNFLIGDPIFFLIVLILLYKMLVDILKPMNTITDTARSISITDLDKRIQYEEKGDEFTKLAKTFNNMLSRLQTSFKQIRRFSSDASHQLKTPLTAIRLQTDVTLKKDRTKEEYKNVLQSINVEIIHLQNMIDNLFLLTKMDDEIIQKNFKDIDLDIILINVVEEFILVASQKRITLDIEEVEHIAIKGEDTLLFILCANLIDNAIKYTPKGKKIIISLKDFTLTIKDEGIGISEENLHLIFERFFRVEASRFDEIKGYGLGMSIVKTILNLHHATIDIKSKLDFGTTIKIKFNNS